MRCQRRSRGAQQEAEVRPDDGGSGFSHRPPGIRRSQGIKSRYCRRAFFAGITSSWPMRGAQHDQFEKSAHAVEAEPELTAGFSSSSSAAYTQCSAAYPVAPGSDE